MRQIKLSKWKARTPNGDEREEDLLDVLNAIVAKKDPNTLPTGIEKFRAFGRIGKAFDSAEESGVLELEEGDYEFLKDIVIRDVRSPWGMNSGIRGAIEAFLDAKEVK